MHIYGKIFSMEAKIMLDSGAMVCLYWCVILNDKNIFQHILLNVYI